MCLKIYLKYNIKRVNILIYFLQQNNILLVIIVDSRYTIIIFFKLIQINLYKLYAIDKQKTLTINALCIF